MSHVICHICHHMQLMMRAHRLKVSTQPPPSCPIVAVRTREQFTEDLDTSKVLNDATMTTKVIFDRQKYFAKIGS